MSAHNDEVLEEQSFFLAL